MAKTFSGETTYTVTPDAAFERHIDEDFLRRKFEAQGATDIAVSSSRAGERVTLKIDRKAQADIPGFAKKVISPTNTIHLVEEWRPEGDGYVCDWTAQISPAPAKLQGTRTLLPSGGGTADVTEGTIEVKVPLIGGKLADWMTGEASRAVQDEVAWIAQQD
jgi:hypothetical protein